MKTITILKETDEGIANAFTGDLIAIDRDGELDVKRPGEYPRPRGIKTKGNLMKAFGAWFLSECCGGTILKKDTDDGEGKAIDIPKCPNEDAIVFLHDHANGHLFQFVGGKCWRVGTVGEKSVFWQYGEKSQEFRDGIHPTYTKKADVDEVCRLVLNSFKGSFSQKASKPKAEKPKASKPTKEKTPSRPTPKSKKKAPPARRKG